MQCTLAIWLLGMGLLAGDDPAGELRRFEYTQTEMAVPFTIVIYSGDDSTANRAAKEAFDRIHELNGTFSDFDPESELRRLCDNSEPGSKTVVSDDLWCVLSTAQDLSTRSEGAFDITVGPVVRLWRKARQLKELPSPESLKNALSLTGYRFVRLDPENHSVELLKKGMKLDLGGIAKGYALDEAFAVLQKNVINRAMIKAGGDIRLGEPPPNLTGWRIAIGQNKLDGKPQSYLSLTNVGVSTSGDTMQFVVINGKKYSHIVDPKTGLGLTDHVQVTVIAKDGITSDGLSTAVNVLGHEKGLSLIEDTQDTAACIICEINGKAETFYSKRWGK
jgi:FAD:protein FMN transferase